MNEHVTAWLGAYHDGELKGRRLRQVATHLAECAACRAELEALQALSTLLHESPAPESLTAPERFVAQVGLRLPRRPTKPAWHRTLEIGWRLIPVALTGAWAFVQAVFIVAGAVFIVLGPGAGVELLPSAGASWLAQVCNLSGVDLPDASRSLGHLWNGIESLGLLILLYLVSLAAIGLLYWSWLASLWARRRHQQWQPEAQLTAV